MDIHEGEKPAIQLTQKLPFPNRFISWLKKPRKYSNNTKFQQLRRSKMATANFCRPKFIHHHQQKQHQNCSHLPANLYFSDQLKSKHSTGAQSVRRRQQQQRRSSSSLRVYCQTAATDLEATARAGKDRLLKVTFSFFYAKKIYLHNQLIY